MVFLFLYSCSKDKVDTFTSGHPQSISSLPSETHIYSTAKEAANTGLRDSSAGVQLKRTILGEVRVNPFTVENMAAAHRDLYGSNLQVMPTTDLYVKFMPTTDEQVQALEETGWIFFDFPIEQEVIEMGDYYQIPDENSDPVLYTVIKPGEQLPAVPHEVIDQLYLDMSDPLLVATSLMRTGNGDEIPKVIPPITPGTTPYENLEFDCQDGFECDPDCKVKIVINDADYPPTLECECDCSGNGDGGYFSCCGTSVDIGHPAGCVRVEDTQLSTHLDYESYLPVRRVRVVLWNGWFRTEVTETDDNGCWVSDKTFSSFHMWIRFVNARHKIRGLSIPTPSPINRLIRTLPVITNYYDPITDYVDHFTFAHRDIRVFYDMWAQGQEGQEIHYYWGAATVNNANHEFHDYAMNDGINSPPNKLDIMVGPLNRSGMTLMKAKSFASIVFGLITGTSSSNQPFHNTLLPDVYLGIRHSTSDWMKELSYHELAHASHSTRVNTDYWKRLVTAEAQATLQSSNNNPHGSAQSLDAGIIAVCESWAEHIGITYTDRTYGGNASQWPNWIVWLERTWNEFQNHIPIGLYHDLIDEEESIFNRNGIQVSACNQQEAGCTIIDDEVSGFTNAQMFDCLTSSTFAPSDFEECLIDNHLSSTQNTLAQVVALFDSY